MTPRKTAAEGGVSRRRVRSGGAAEPARFLDHYLPYLLGHASQVMNKEFDDSVRAAGLTPVEWRSLATLRDHDGLTIGALCRIVVAQQPTLTKAVKRLSEVGLARRLDDAEDLRRTRVFATAKGRRVAAALMRSALDHERRLVDSLTPGELRVLKETLRRILARRDRAGALQPLSRPAGARAGRALTQRLPDRIDRPATTCPPRGSSP